MHLIFNIPDLLSGISTEPSTWDVAEGKTSHAKCKADTWRELLSCRSLEQLDRGSATHMVGKLRGGGKTPHLRTALF